MALQLAPETEIRVREHAARNGVSVDELLRRAFADDPPVATAPPPATEGTRKETREESHARVMATLAEMQKETGGVPVPPGGFKTVAELFSEWEAEDANLTPEQVEEEHRFWEEYQRERGKYPIEI